MSNIVVPQLGESVVEARVAKWLKHEGDRVETGEPVVELETEKIDLEVGADHGGVIRSIKAKEGEDVKVGDLLAVVEDGAGAPAPSPAPAPSAAPANGDRRPADDDTRATPTARRMAKEHDVKLDAVQGSGSAGRVTKKDVQGAIAPAPAAAKAPAAPASAPAPVSAPAKPSPSKTSTSERTEDRSRMSKRRLTIARRLVEAQSTAAMLTTFNEVDMSGLMSLRARHKESFQKQHGVGLGISSFFVKATIAALREFPQINAELQGDEIVLKRYYDIGVAVGAEGGLVVPVLRDANAMSFADIELAIRDFARRAGDGTLTLEDLAGGTFTITNGGVFGSLLSTPILNPPQSGILGMHKIEDRPVAADGQVVIRPMMYLALSYDHRLVDGAQAVTFLVRVKERLEDPVRMLLEV
jgi:2-oxoglutarate dehydrogenase E2 component (dihydrolipoamide succinyltransferase)